MKPVSTETVSAGSVGLTGVIQGHVHDQLVAHAAVQTIGAHSHNLYHVAGVGHQVLDDRPLVAVGRRLREGTLKKGLQLFFLIHCTYMHVWIS